MTLTEAAALAAALLFAAIALFQLALALGAPWGAAAWGGQQTGVLPRGLRLGSAIAMGVWVVAALFVLERGGVVAAGLPPRATAIVLWGFIVLLAVGALLNALSRSPIERRLWTPVSAAASLLCLIVQLSA